MNLFGRKSDTDPLAVFDENETQDLALHVRQCGRRYAALLDSVDTLRTWFIILVLVLIASNVIDLPALASRFIGG